MVKQYEVYWIDLNPTKGSEINKTRPCVVLSPSVSNKHLNTILIAPCTSTIRNFPMRVNLTLNKKKGQIALDQIRCIDKARLIKKIETLRKAKILEVKQTLKEFLID